MDIASPKFLDPIPCADMSGSTKGWISTAGMHIGADSTKVRPSGEQQRLVLSAIHMVAYQPSTPRQPFGFLGK